MSGFLPSSLPIGVLLCRAANTQDYRVTKLEISATLYTPETVAALARYREHLRETEEKLAERRVLAINELRSYGDGEVDSETVGSSDGGTLAAIAHRYGDLSREVETVRMEIARLGE